MRAGKERGDAGDEPALPRFSIPQLFEMLLHLAEQRARVEPSREPRQPCLRCLRRDMYGEGAAAEGEAVANAPEEPEASEAPTSVLDPGDRRYWSNVSPDSSWMDAHLPDHLPDPTLSPSVAQSPDRTANAPGDDAIASGPTSTYYSSRASSPSPSRIVPPRRFRDTVTNPAAPVPNHAEARPSSSRPMAAARTSSRDPQATTHTSCRHRSSTSIPASAVAPTAASTSAAAVPARATSAWPAVVAGPHVGTRLPAPAAPPVAAPPVAAPHVAAPHVAAPPVAAAPVAAPPAAAPPVATAPVAAPPAAAPPVAAPPVAVPPVAVPPVAAVAPAAALPAANVHGGQDGTAQVWYVVTRGRRVGVFDNHSLVVWSVTGVRGNASRSFGTREEAERAYQEALDMRIVQEVPAP
ncbi:hypothetical protein VTO73DRAFT_10520 [Trametes versicolor]